MARDPLEGVSFLRECPLLEDVTERDWRDVAKTARLMSAKKGAFYFRQGEPPTTIYALVHGQVEVTRLAYGGHQTLLRLIASGELFGYEEVLTNTPRLSSAYVNRESQAFVWDASTMLRIMTRYPQVALNLLRLTAERLLTSWDRLEGLGEHVEQRVARALLRLAKTNATRGEGRTAFSASLSQQILAEFAGTNFYSVSRILGRWERSGIVERGREWIDILDPGRLITIGEVGSRQRHETVDTDRRGLNRPFAVNMGDESNRQLCRRFRS